MKFLKSINILILFFIVTCYAYSQAPYYLKVMDKVQLDQHPGLEIEALAASLATPVKPGDAPFKVYSYDIYPVLGAAVADYGLESMKQWAIDDLESKPYYLGIIKEYVKSSEEATIGSEWEVRFKILVKLPNTPNYDKIEFIEKEILENQVELEMKNKFKTLSGYKYETSVPTSEIEGLKYFIKTLNELKEGKDIELFDDSEFVEINMPGVDIRTKLKENFRGENRKSTNRNQSFIESAQIEIKQNGVYVPFAGCYNLTGNITVNGVQLKYFLNTAGYMGTSNGRQGAYLSRSEMERILDEDSSLDIAFQLWSVSDLNSTTPPVSGYYEAKKFYYRTISRMNADKLKQILDTEFIVNIQKSGFESSKLLGGTAFRNDINTESRNSGGWEEWGKSKVGTGTSSWEAIGYGIIDGFLGSIHSIYTMGKGLQDGYAGLSSCNQQQYEGMLIAAIKRETIVLAVNFPDFKATFDKIKVFYEKFFFAGFDTALTGIKDGLQKEFGELISGTPNSFYILGKILFEVIFEATAAVLSGGGSITLFFKEMIENITKNVDDIGRFIGGMIDNTISVVNNPKKAGESAKKWFKCKILGKGCFVKDTPILMASNPFRNTAAAYAIAALPIVSVPIQNVQLFDYAVAHKSVNSSYGQTASSEDNYIFGKDPYTSDQQRSRDQYTIDDQNWNEVAFEQVLGSSKCKLALHNDWINQHNYTVDSVVNMNLPEQGISGPFKITSIKHIIPQKKPVDQDPNDEYEFRPVTGLFVHESNDIWKIKFEHGTELGVTNNHPIFSISKGDWQHAGHLEIGEEVLAKGGNTKVVSKKRDLTVQPVYNLEIKYLHNFLVGDVGVVVHNTPNCLETAQEHLKKLGIKDRLKSPGKHLINEGPDASKIKQKFGKDKLEVCFDDLGMPDFSEFVATINGIKAEVKVPNLKGTHSNKLGDDYELAAKELCNKLGMAPCQTFHGAGSSFTGSDGIKWTWHHHQDGETMQLIPTDINGKAGHVGGATIIQAGGKGDFPDPSKISKSKCN